MRARSLSVCLVALATSTLLLAATPQDEHTELEEHMELIEGSVKRLRRSMRDPEKVEESLEQLQAESGTEVWRIPELPLEGPGLIHGLSESRSVWSRQVDFLQRSMNVVSYDVRGFGQSPVGAGNGTVGQMADDLAQILSACDTGPAWLIGFSMGGVIAQRFALDFPGLVRGLLLVASSCKVGRPGQEFFNSRIEQVSRDGLAAIAAITETVSAVPTDMASTAARPAR